MTDALTNAELVLRDAARGVALSEASFTHAADALAAERERTDYDLCTLASCGHSRSSHTHCKASGCGCTGFRAAAPPLPPATGEAFEPVTRTWIEQAPTRPTPEPSEAMVEAAYDELQKWRNGTPRAVTAKTEKAEVRSVTYAMLRAALAAQEGK